MSDLELTCACLRYDHTLPLFDGSVRFEGVAASMQTAEIPSEIFEPMLRKQAFDVAELGLTYMLRLLDAGDTRFAALPVFLARTFRHAAIFINTSKGIARPEDLRGRLIGEFCMYGHDAGVWAKGVLSDFHGVTPSQSRWITGGSDWYMPPLDFIPLPRPADVDVRESPKGKTLGQMLDAGEIDAFISSRAPQCFMDGSPNVARLFPDYEAAERSYYAQTGIFPIMHTLIVRRELLAQHPGLAQSLYKGFSEAKQAAMERYRKGMVEQNIKSLAPWTTPLLERNDRAFPEDWWPYGIAANRAVIDTFARYFFEQGLSTRRFRCEDIFAPELLHT